MTIIGHHRKTRGSDSVLGKTPTPAPTSASFDALSYTVTSISGYFDNATVEIEFTIHGLQTSRQERSHLRE